MPFSFITQGFQYGLGQVTWMTTSKFNSEVTEPFSVDLDHCPIGRYFSFLGEAKFFLVLHRVYAVPEKSSQVLQKKNSPLPSVTIKQR